MELRTKQELKTDVCVLIMDLYYYTTLNMEICNLKRNPSWRKMPMDHFSSNHVMSRRQEMCSCSELSTDWPYDIYQGMKHLWKNVIYGYINIEKNEEILQSQNFATVSLKN